MTTNFHRPPTTRQILDFINTEAFLVAAPRFKRRAYHIEGAKMTFDPDRYSDHNDRQWSITMMPDGTADSVPPYIPLRQVHSKNRLAAQPLLHTMFYEAHEIVEAVVNEWLHPYTRESLHLERFPVNSSDTEPRTQDIKAINGAINRLSHTVRNGGLTGYVRNPEAIIQYQVNQLLGPETAALTTTYAGIFANIRHFNAVVAHGPLLAQAKQLNPNALTLWMGLHCEDIHQQFDTPGLTPHQIVSAAQAHFNTHVPTTAHTDAVWQAFTRLNPRIIREMPHDQNDTHINRIRLLCDYMAQTGATPPYSIAKRYTKGKNIPYHLVTAQVHQILNCATMMASESTRAQRGSTITQMSADVENINQMLSCLDSCFFNGYDEMSLINQIGINTAVPSNIDVAWRKLSTIAREYISIAGNENYPTPHTKAFFHHLRNSDLRAYDRPCPAPSRRHRPTRAINPRGEHLQQAIDADMLVRLQNLQMHYGLKVVPDQSVTLHIDGCNIIRLTKDAHGCITAEADESYWLGQPLPHPDTNALDNQNTQWSTRQSITVATASRIAKILAAHWPDVSDKGRPIKPPSSHVVYRHRRGIEKLLPPHLHDALNADRDTSQNLRNAIARLLDRETYLLGLRLTGAVPNLDVYNIVAAAGQHLAETAIHNPMAAIIYLWQNIRQLDTRGAPQSRVELAQDAQRYLTKLGFPAEHWDQASKLTADDVQRALNTRYGPEHAVKRLLIMALAQTHIDDETYESIVATPKHLHLTRIPSFTLNFCRAAAMACQHFHEDDTRINEPISRIAVYIEYLDQTEQALEQTTWRELQQAAMAHTNAQHNEEITQQWVQDLVVQKGYEQTWRTLVHEQTVDGYNIVPLNSQHELLQQNWIHHESSIYYDHHYGFNGTARFFAIADAQHDEPTSFVSIQRDLDQWRIRQIIPAHPEMENVITRIAERLLNQYRAVYENASPYIRDAGYLSSSRTLPPAIRDTLPADALHTPRPKPNEDLPF